MNTAHNFETASPCEVPPVRFPEHRTVYRKLGKRCLDIGLALLLLPAVTIVVFVLSAFVRRDGGSAFFGQRRIGQYGEEFTCWKIRTMREDADIALAKLLESDPEIAAEWEQNRKLKNDPRITKIGGFLRATSLDELPQIFNVLNGSMSFVGPRPIVRDEIVRYDTAFVEVFALRPGISGYWQVSGRNEVSYDERVAMDVRYAREHSFATDLKVKLQTVTVMFKLTGY